MIASLEQGNADTFFSLWQRHLPPAVLRDDVTCTKLEFYVQMFFAVQPLHPHAPRPAKVGRGRGERIEGKRAEEGGGRMAGEREKGKEEERKSEEKKDLSCSPSHFHSHSLTHSLIHSFPHALFSLTLSFLIFI